MTSREYWLKFVNDPLLKRIVTGILLLNLIVAGNVGYSLLSSKTDFENQAMISTGNISHVLEENISGIIGKADLSLLAIADEAEQELIQGAIRKDELDKSIIRQQTRLPQLATLRATNAAGDAIYGRKTAIAKTSSLAHRDYFTYLRSTPTAGMVISKPLVGGISGKWMIILARRFNNPDGTFAGLVYTGIGLDYLTQSFSQVNVGKLGSISLFDADLSLIVRSPHGTTVDADIGRKVASPRLTDLVTSGKPAGTYRAVSSIDGKERMYSYNMLNLPRPYYIVVGFEKGTYLKEWHAETVNMIVFFLLFCCITVVSAWFFYRELRRTRDAEQNTLKSEQRFRLFVENANDLIYTLSPDGIITYVAPNVQLLLGHSPPELTGTLFAPLIHPDELPATLKFLQEIVTTGVSQSGLEYRIRHKNGNWRWFISNASIVTDVVSGAQLFLGIGRDITDRKLTEKSLLESEEKYRILLEESSDSIFSLTPEGCYGYANRAFTRSLGKRTEEVIGHTLWDVFPRDGADMRFAALSLAFSRREVREIEVRIPGVGGDRHYMTTITPIVSPKGDALSAICSARDITKLKSAETALRETALQLDLQKQELLQINETLEQRVTERTAELLLINTRFTQVAEHGRMVVWEVDPQGRYTYISDMSTALYRVRPEAAIGTMHLYDMLAPSERQDVMEKLVKMFANREPFIDFEHGSILDDDGRTIWVSTNGIPQLDGSGTFLGYRGTDIDISAGRKLQEQLSQSQKLESVGRLAGGIAHDFNNKLMVILGYAELAREDIDSPAKVLEYLDEISTAAGLSRQITLQLLGFSRQQIAAPRALNVNSLIVEIQKTLPRLIGEQIALVFSPDNALWNVKLDPVQFDQIVMNMAVNARDAMPEGGEFSIGTANITIDAGHSRTNIDIKPGECVCITFGDTGTGIDKNTLKHIFDPFFTTKEPGKGTGLGLATIHGIISQNGGFIEVATTPGKGTCFSVFFPRHDAEIQSCVPRVTKPATGSGSILLIEDEAPLRKMVTIFLGKIGYVVYAAATPGEALKIAADSDLPLNLVLTDVVLPGMNGLELFERIREMRPGIKVVYVSGYYSEYAALKTVSEEGLFIQKPYDLKKLSELLKILLTDGGNTNGSPSHH